MPDVYQQQIDLAQEFLNENPQADVSRVQCLLRKIIPTLYHPFIDKLHCQHTMGNTINVWGGQNQIAPQAKFASQYFNMDRYAESDTKNIEQDLYEIDKIVRRHGNYAWGIRKLQELDMSNEKVLNVMDSYVHNADVEDVLSIIRTPQTEVQAFALLEAALTVDDNSLLKSLIHNHWIKNCRNTNYKPLICAAIERLSKNN